MDCFCMQRIPDENPLKILCMRHESLQQGRTVYKLAAHPLQHGHRQQQQVAAALQTPPSQLL